MPADGRVDAWRDRRARRLAELPWVRREDRADGTPVRFVADELVVLDEHLATARQAFAEQGFTGRDIVEEGDVPAGLRRLRVAGLDVARAVRRVRVQAEAAGDTRVAAGPNHVFGPARLVPGGTYGPPRPAPPGPAAGLEGRGEPEVAVLVLDTGVWLDSPLPKDRYVTDDYAPDAGLDDEAMRDGDAGHANFVAGVLVGRSGRVRPRVAGVVDPHGVCRESDLVAALRQAGDEPVILIGLGGYTLDDRPSPLLTRGLAALLGGGDRVVVAAAGNDGQHDRPFWPAAYAGARAWAHGPASPGPAARLWRQVVAVAAHDGRRICDWSNTGPWISLAAPGADVVSTFVHHEDFPGGWARWSGTSFAAPAVAAAIAEALPATGSATAAAEAVIAGADRRFGRYAGVG